MSMLRNTREMIAEAIEAAGIDGVSASTYPPAVQSAGVAWPRFVSCEVVQYSNTHVAVRPLFEAVLTLPSETAQSTAEAEDDWLEPILTAVSSVGAILSAEVFDLTTGDSPQRALRVRLRT